MAFLVLDISQSTTLLVLFPLTEPTLSLGVHDPLVEHDRSKTIPERSIAALSPLQHDSLFLERSL